MLDSLATLFSFSLDLLGRLLLLLSSCLDKLELVCFGLCLFLGLVEDLDLGARLLRQVLRLLYLRELLD